MPVHSAASERAWAEAHPLQGLAVRVCAWLPQQAGLLARCTDSIAHLKWVGR